jgi:hypothetical protein
MAIASHLSRIIGVLLLAGGLAACSAFKLGYNALPDVAYWWLDGYADFTDAQSPRVREDLARLHAWHRATELPRLNDILVRMEQLAPGEITAAQACGVLSELQARAMAVAEQAEPAAVTLAMGLAPAQLVHLQRKYDENNRNFRKDWIEAGVEAQREKRMKQLLERLEMIYGRLEAAQRGVLQETIAQSVFDPQRSLAERQRRQQDLLQTLRRLSAPGLAFAEARALMRGYIERVASSPNPAYRDYQRALLDEGCRIVAAVHARATPAQREQAARRLRAYQRDLRELAPQP